MRRRWKVLVAVGAVALVVGVVFFLPSRDDGLDWVRKHGEVESWIALPLNTASGDDGYAWVRQFTFESLPKSLESDVRKRVVELRANSDVLLGGPMADGRKVFFSRKYKKLYVSRETKLTELFRKWDMFKNRVGWSKPADK